MSEHWSAKYVGLPYETGGRDRDGVDCWGLVRLVHAAEFGNQLPSFEEEYHSPHDACIQELIARHREGWGRVDDPQSGDVVVFRVWGGLQHVGIITEPGFFLHVRSGRTATVERLDGSIWRNRVEGIYRYERKAETVSVAGYPHPLRTIRLDGDVPAGLTVAEIQEWVYAQTCAPGEQTRSPAVITIDGFTIPKERWNVVKPLPGQRVEYRAIAEGDSYKQLMMIGVMVGAMVLAPYLAPFLVPMLGGIGSLSLATSVATAAIAGVGGLLVNFLFPTRPPDQNKTKPDKRMNMLEGGSNSPTPYGAIPVVLGAIKFTPPLAAQNYAETYGEKSYLRTVLCWGYGPLQVTDMRIGDLPIDSLDEIKTATINGETGETNTDFNAIYPRDVSQVVLSDTLVCNKKTASSYSRVAGGLTTVTISGHGASAGWMLNFVPESKWYEIATVVDANTVQFTSSLTTAGSGSSFTALLSPVTRTVIPGFITSANVAVHFPGGLKSQKTDGTKDLGDWKPSTFGCSVQVRQLDDVTLNPLTAWGNISGKSVATSFTLPTAFFTATDDAKLDAVYQWHFITVDEHGKIKIRSGAYTTNSAADPSGTLLTELQAANTGFDVTFSRFPTIQAGEIELWRVLIYGDTVSSTTDRRAASSVTITGGALTNTGRSFNLAAATYARALEEVILYSEYFQKNPFTDNVTFEFTSGRWEARIFRTTDSDPNTGLYGSNRTHSFEAIAVAVTGFSNNKPVNPPKPLAMTAIRVRASNQINGTTDGFSAVCTSVCKDWDYNALTWITRPTRNPASLFRYVLQHPANAQAVANSDIDLTALASWHNYCRTNKFMCDMVILEQRSILEILRDVAACGRASPALRDGKWTVLVDKQIDTIAQYFTPANSWGFEGQRAFPKLPHAFRVLFNNSDRAWQDDEMIVYNDGYTASNATLYESLTLPGVTTKAAIYKHARFHLAQLKLRPETYTLNVDIEHLICQRGDRVKVTHDVPMWGTAAGRIKTFVSTTNIILSEPIPMAAGTQYGIRIRLEDGSSITRTIASKATAGLYTDITLTATITSTEGKAGNLFMVGTINAESVDCLVLSVEPQENMSARLTLVDYAPAVYNSDSETVPNFNSLITKPPSLLQDKITASVTIRKMVSDEKAMLILNNGQYGYRIGVSYSVPASGLPKAVKFIEGGIIADSSYASGKWKSAGSMKIGEAFYFDDVKQGVSYRMRLRLTDGDGRAGPWVETTAHTVVGRLIAPLDVQNLTASVTDGRLYLYWDTNPEIDIVGYEIRTANSGWGTAGYLARLTGTRLEVTPAASGTARTWYVKARNSADLMSANPASASFTVTPPGTVSAPTQSVTTIGTGLINISLRWDAPTGGSLAIAGYEIRSADSNWGTAGALYNGSARSTVLAAITSTAVTTYYIKAYDIFGNWSATATSFTHDVTAPPTMQTSGLSIQRKATVLNVSLVIYPTKPTDFDCFEFRIAPQRSTGTLGDDTPNALPTGTFSQSFWDDPDVSVFQTPNTSISVDLRTFEQPYYSTAGITYVAMCKMRDKSGNYSAAACFNTLTVTSIT